MGPGKARMQREQIGMRSLCDDKTLFQAAIVVEVPFVDCIASVKFDSIAGCMRHGDALRGAHL